LQQHKFFKLVVYILEVEARKLSVDVELKSGEIAFKWFNDYAGVTIKTPSKTLVIDPADINPREFTNVDIILITHEHYDHLDQAIIREVYKRTNCKVLADPTSTRRLRSVVDPDKLREVNIGEEVEFENLKIKVEKCDHPPATTPVTFLITSEDGMKVYHTADSLPFTEMKKIGEEYTPDIVFCTVGIAPGCSPKTGVEIAKLINPKVAVPYHTASRRELEKFAELLSKEMPTVKCLLAEKGKIYKYP